MMVRKKLHWGIVALCLLGAEQVQAAEAVAVAKTVQRLIAAARIYDEREMLAASEQLVKLGRPAVPALLAASEDSEPNVRWQAILALGRIGRKAAGSAQSRLVDALQDDDPDVRAAAAESLGLFQVADVEVLQGLREQLADRQPLVRVQVLASLWQLTGETRYLAELVDHLRAKDWMAVDAAVRHLARSDTAAVTSVRPLLSSKQAGVVVAAAKVLEGIGVGASAAQAELTTLALGENRTCAQAAAEALAKMGESGIAALIQIVAHRRGTHFGVAICALGKTGSRLAVDVLEDVIARDAETLQVAAIQALGELGEVAEKASGTLVLHLDSPNADVRGACLGALAHMPSEDAATRKILEIARNDDVDFVRSAALAALKRLSAESLGRSALSVH